MKKLLVFAMVLCMVAALAACTEVVRITVENPQKIMVEKSGGSIAITLTDAETVKTITDVVCQLPLQSAEPKDEGWTYRITWLDAQGTQLTMVTLNGAQLRWQGQSYTLGIGMDLSVVTDQLEKVLQSLPVGKS